MGLTKVRNVIDITADTMSDLLKIKHKKGSVQLLGFHERGDGGGGVFYWDESQDKANHNGGTIIDPNNSANLNSWDNASQIAWFTADTGSGCWVREYSGAVNVKWFGAKGDGNTDSRRSILAALSYYDNVEVSGGDFFISSGIAIANRENINLFSSDNSIIRCPSRIVNQDDATFLFDNCPNSSIDGLDLRPAVTDTIYVLKRWDSNGDWIPDDNFASSTVGSHPLIEAWNESKADFPGHQFGNEPQPFRDWLAADSQNAALQTNVSPRVIMRNADGYTIKNMRGMMLLLEMKNTSNSVIKDNHFLAGKGTWGCIRIDNQEREDYGENNKILNNTILYGSYSGIAVSRTKRTLISGNTIYRCGESGVKTDQNIDANHPEWFSRRNYKTSIIGNFIKQSCYDGIDFLADNISANSYDAPRRGDEFDYTEYAPYKLPTEHIITNNSIIGSHGVGLWGDGQGHVISNNNVIDGQIAGAKLRTSFSQVNNNSFSNNNLSNSIGNHQIQSSGVATLDYPDNKVEEMVITNNHILIDNPTINTGDKIWYAGIRNIVSYNIGSGAQGGYNISSGIDNLKYLNVSDNDTTKYGLDAILKTQKSPLDPTNVSSGVQIIDNGNKGQITTATVETGNQYHWRLMNSTGYVGYVTTDGNKIKFFTDDQNAEICINGHKFGTNKVVLNNLPTSAPAETGQLWNDSGTVKVS